MAILNSNKTLTANNNFSDINASKANFDAIYEMADPRAYFSTLGGLDYMIPDVAEPVLRQLLMARSAAAGTENVILDVGCSYGINAAVHRFPLSFDTLRRRYARRELAALSGEETIRLDRNYFASWPDTGLARYIGLDVSAPAVGYAKSVGLLDDGIVANLEAGPLSVAQAKIARRANVVLATGCVGYVTEKTYNRLLGAMDSPPWIVSFVLRMFPYDRLAAAFSDHGLVTEKLQGATFVQRRFRDENEFMSTIATLEELGIDPSGFEAEGLFQADLYVSRPEKDVRHAPLEEIVTVTSGRNKALGPRYVRVETDEGTQVALEP